MNDIAKALDATHTFLVRYVVFASPEQADACALWSGYTWFYDVCARPFGGYVTCNRRAAMRPEYVLILAIIVVVIVVVFIALHRNDQDH